MAEAVYGPGKTPDQVARIVAELLARSDEAPVVLTRADAAQIRDATDANPGATVVGGTVVWRAAAASAPSGSCSSPPAPPTYRLPTSAPPRSPPTASRRSASPTSGSPASTGCSATPTSWPRPTPSSWWPGMEGALASVVGGLTGAPVIAVPTSVGYGAGLEGVTALLGMLASCAAGITVVGIDNGYGAACAVARMFVSPTGVRRAAGDRQDQGVAP